MNGTPLSQSCSAVHVLLLGITQQVVVVSIKENFIFDYENELGEESDFSAIELATFAMRDLQ